EPADESLGHIDRILNAGCRMIQFRCKTRPFNEIRHLFKEILGLCEQYHACLLLNATVELALESGAHGCHLSSTELINYRPAARPYDFIIGASCHDQKEISIAEINKLDYIQLGPVARTNSHTDQEGIGWDSFRTLAQEAGLPVYAIGGMQLEDLQTAWECGAQGIAAISGIWSRAGKNILSFEPARQMISA
ncbi:MAG: thiamine phosphate synthase, partial [Thiotrichales bacterium]|nr:thiamine phosphate synthase [Thiotrichales bacterium]